MDGESVGVVQDHAGRAARIVEVLRGYEIACPREFGLQSNVESVFETEGIRFEREFVISKRDRIDFVVDGDIAVECKVDGSWPEVLAQLMRYAEHPQIKAIVLVTTKAVHAKLNEMEVQGKVIRVCFCCRC